MACIPVWPVASVPSTVALMTASPSNRPFEKDKASDNLQTRTAPERAAARAKTLLIVPRVEADFMLTGRGKVG